MKSLVKEKDMYKLMAREKRGCTVTDWLKSAHSFSFEQYFDPFNMGFSDLRAINDNVLSPSSKTERLDISNMEIVTLVLDGAIEYKNLNEKSKILTPDQVQVISSGTGIIHQEFNPSPVENTHYLQIWILPNKKNIQPCFKRKAFAKEKFLNRIKLIISGSGKNNSVKIFQDAEIYKSILEADKTVYFDIPENRKLWLQVAKGAIDVNSNILEAGDGMSIIGEVGEMEINGVDLESNFLIFNLRNLTI